MTESLSREQKMFNQRILAEHCLPEDKTRQILESLFPDNDCPPVEDTLATCNEQLTTVGLEIVSVSMKGTKYFCLINKFPDEISRKSFEALFSPQQHAFVRVVLEKLVTDGPTKSSALLNARLEEQPSGSEEDEKTASAAKLPLSAAEQVLDVLQEELWLESIKTDKGTKALALAPRTYAEMGYLLEKEFGMDKDDMPQQIYYRK